MPQAFISYSHKDKDFVQYLAYRLAEQTVPFWVDEDKLYGGVMWENEISSGLYTADVLILVVTPDSIVSKAVEKEWRYFYDNKKPIISLIIRDTEIADELQKFQWINDFTNTSGFQSGFDKLLNALQRYNFVFDHEQIWIDYGVHSPEENLPPVRISTQDFISTIRKLNHSIRVCFPIRFNVPSEFVGYGKHVQDLRELIGTRVWFQNDDIHEVSSNFYHIESILFNHRLPHFMKRFFERYQELLSSRWIKVAYLDNPEHPYIVETLPADETLLNDLLNSAVEFCEEFDRRKSNIHLPPQFKLQIQDELSNADIKLHTVALEEVANDEFREQPHSYHKVHCGYVRIDWIDKPSEEQRQLAQTIVEKIIQKKFWFLSNFHMPIISG
ncbi:MAG: TIR domain-containing protein [Anaerolineaceae bacterium]|nr:TIR domain-containing protein [Anaerolineaceae bacterium]